MTELELIGARARAASAQLTTTPGDVRRSALVSMARSLGVARDRVLKANARDVVASKAAATSAALTDRLRLSEARIASMVEGLLAVSEQPDPIGEVLDEWDRPNGLRIVKARVPIGVVAVIYEARPNVTADVAGLCVMSANAVILRGSSHALATNEVIADALRAGLAAAGVPEDSVQLMRDVSREGAKALMQLKASVDLLIPRGGKELIASIERDATVPYIIDGDGNCHIYVDQSADPEMATKVVIDAKTSRPGVCNAAETLLVHRAVAESWLPHALAELSGAGVQIRGDEEVCELWPAAVAATESDWETEYLDLILAVRVVGSIDEAIEHIGRYGTKNAEAIVTSDEASAERFVEEVDSGTVFVNASTRFSDGGQFGFGSEIGISTQKLHARGPMGLRELTTYKYVVRGDGQVRG